jgi:hypothetical protein
VILALFIFGVAATSSGEGEPTTASVAEPSHTLDHLVSNGHSILSSVTTEPMDSTTTIVDGHTNHPPVVNDVPIDPLNQSFIETVQEVAAESNTSGDKEVLEDFLAELFQNTEGEPSADPADPANPVQTPLAQKPKSLTEEEIAERKRLLAIETREKRIEITGRHTQWEARLEERGKEELAELIKQVNELRAHVSNDVGNNEEISKLLNGFENEANRAIKGVEAFFEKRIKIGKKVEESVIKTWEDVLKKVDKKIDDKEREVEKEMQEYYNSYIEEESARASTPPLIYLVPQSLCNHSYQVEAAIKRVQNFADDAQADLGMDYAWLDDVCVKDWTRYHDLGRSTFEGFVAAILANMMSLAAKRWGDIYRSVFNSTHPELSSNEVVSALDKVQATLQDVGVGFDHVLGNLQRKAERIFKGDHTIEDIPGLGDEEVAEKAAQKDEEVPVLGLSGGSASATQDVHHTEL